ncbi:polysaccharide deacetylase family protein [Amycolatopsis sp. CA-126428]|uniref:polysaccharide deacetylase family protein n=1 Tax=Amycolatopsis sp. CA-126428 TaxID=2073158 RepID=UPI000CD25425|nr:polysaccharide deacetylase family protein [Amycolatopsis sp. CA-126428]
MKLVLPLAALALAHAGPAAAFLPGPRRALLPGLAGTTVPGRIALTFDDGPATDSTPQFLRVLAEHDVHATFFVLGTEARKVPGLIAEIAAAGHEIGVHGWDHRCLLRKTPARTHRELRATRDLVERLTGTRPRWFRAPYGVFSTGSLVSARALGLRPILWSTWGFDWTEGCTPDSIHRRVSCNLGTGGTILLHDSDVTTGNGAWRATLGALPAILAECRGRGLRIGALGHAD